jgi:hypothetical protein
MLKPLSIINIFTSSLPGKITFERLDVEPEGMFCLNPLSLTVNGKQRERTGPNRAGKES